MPLLDSLLAFILIVFAVSMAVTVVVQVILDLSQFRRFRFRRMLSRYIDHGLLPATRLQLEDTTYNIPSQERAQLMTLLSGANSSDGGAAAGQKGPLPETGTRFVDLDAEKVGSQLRASTLGQSIAAKIKTAETAKATAAGDPAPKSEEIEKATKAFFDRLTALYEGFTSRAAETYRRFARILSMTVGIGLALAINADAISLLRTLVQEPTIRTALATPGEEMIKTLTKINEQLPVVAKALGAKDKIRTAADALTKKLDEIEIPGDLEQEDLKKVQDLTTEVTKLKDLADAMEESLTKQAISAADQEALRAGIALVDLTVDDKLGFGLQPLFFGSADSVAEDALKSDGSTPQSANAAERGETAPEAGAKSSRGPSLLGVIGCIFMGFLAGLGAPFWHDLIKSVAQARRTFRNPQSALD